MATTKKRSMGRRTFLAASAAAGITIVRASQVRGSQANSAIEIGLIGCGGRGRWIARLFAKHGGYRIVAVADYFDKQVEFVGNEHKVPADRRYTSLSAYKKLIDSKLDAVIIETPPGFHPVHSAAAVEAGKHTYVAKPIAVDVPGCLSIGESGKRARDKKLVFLVDFQTRANELYREAVKRVHAGDIGKIVCGESRYPWAADPTRGRKVQAPEDRLRNWYGITAISGDFIVEQNIHTLDVATWLLDANPVKAEGQRVKGKFGRNGDISDGFSITYTFPENVLVSFNSVQCCPGTPDAIICRMYGTEGIIDTDYFDHVWIKGNKPYEGGELKHLYTTGAENNIVEFHRCVTQGDFTNSTVSPSVRSNLTGVLGRTAAYKSGVVTWNDLMQAGERLEPDLSGLEA